MNDHTPIETSEAPAGWEGAEEWMPLAWELCAEEHGEEACSELVWEGGPIPEPWGDRWLKYEDEAKRLIALVRKCTALAASRPTTAPVVPAGHVVVPVEPTDAMVTAGGIAWERSPAHDVFGPLEDAWAAMLAAALAAPVVPQPAAIADHACASTAVVSHGSPNVRDKTAAQQGEAAARCEPVTSCKSCRHALGRQSCALARRDFDGGRPAAPPDWCPLPIYTASPARQAVTLTLDQIGDLEAGADALGLSWAAKVSLTRAVERAHGITPDLCANCAPSGKCMKRRALCNYTGITPAGGEAVR